MKKKDEIKVCLVGSSGGHFIIGNTTFGWWAQYMSQNPNKIVVAPSKWMAVEMPIDLYESNWHLINV